MIEGNVGRSRLIGSAAGMPMLRKLCVRSDLSDAERGALLALPLNEVRSLSRDHIVHEGEFVSSCCVLLEGVACSYKLLSDGARQIASLHFAGDIIDLHTMVLKAADHGIAILGDARVAYIPHEALLGAAAQHPGIARALWREAFVDGSIHREWLLNIGRRDAYGRLAHLLCELLVRLEAVGLSRGRRFWLPATQLELADATALTSIHVNRTMHRLRADGLITTRGSEVTINDRCGLVLAASFDPAYLHLDAANSEPQTAWPMKRATPA